jgi:hypothetical protein
MTIILQVRVFPVPAIREEDLDDQLSQFFSKSLDCSPEVGWCRTQNRQGCNGTRLFSKLV